METTSTFAEHIKADGARIAAVASASPRPQSIGAIWDHAQRLWLECRSLHFGTGLDGDWDRLSGQRAGLTEEQGLALANEALEFFKEKRAGVDAAVAAARKSHEARDHMQRHGNNLMADQYQWGIKNLGLLWQLGADFHEIGATIELAKGKPNASVFAPDGRPSIGDDVLLLRSLLADVEARMKAAGAVIALLRKDADARERQQIDEISKLAKGSKK